VGISKLLFEKKKQEEDSMRKKYKVLSTHDDINGNYVTRLR